MSYSLRSTAYVAATCIIALSTSHPVLADWLSVVGDSNPLNWYRLDELDGPTAIDYGSEGLNGAYGLDFGAPTRGAAGRVGVAVTFDGDRDSIILNGSDLTGDWTAEFVVRRDVAAGRSAILMRGFPFAFPSTALKLEQHDAPDEVGYTQFGVDDYVFTPTVEAPVGEFIHLVYVKDATTVHAYVNGALAGTHGEPISLSRFQLGDTLIESPFATLDEVVVYDRALSAMEIANHFAAVPEPSTLAFGASGAAILAAMCARCCRRWK